MDIISGMGSPTPGYDGFGDRHPVLGSILLLAAVMLLSLALLHG